MLKGYKVKCLTIGIAFFVLSGEVTFAKAATTGHHPCETDALSRSDRLLRLHYSGDSNSKDMDSPFIDSKATVQKPIKNPIGKNKFDVLEVKTALYKAQYRTRFIYAQLPGSCILMGQEILELAVL